MEKSIVKPQKGWLQARNYFEEQDIPLPEVEGSMMAALLEIQEGLFSTRKELPCSPYDLEAYVAEFLTHPMPPYVLIGFAGHGISSRAIHYYSISEHLAIFAQLSYGNAFSDESFLRDRIDAIFHGLDLLSTAARKCQDKHLLPKERRLLLVESDFYGSGWGWIDGHPHTIDPDKWHTEDPLLDALLAMPCKP